MSGSNGGQKGLFPEKRKRDHPMYRTAAELLARAEPVAKVAEVCGVTERQIYRWKNEVRFQQFYEEAEKKLDAEMGDILAMVRRRMRLLVPTSLVKLQRILDDDEMPAFAQLRAIETVLRGAGVNDEQPAGADPIAAIRDIVQQLAGGAAATGGGAGGVPPAPKAARVPPRRSSG